MSIVKIIITIILLCLSAVFSGSETSFTTITPHRLKMLLDEKKRGAERLEKVLKQKDKMLSVILIFNNIVNIAASSLCTIIVQEIWGKAAVSIGTGILTLLVLIFGEITPKTIATYRAEKIALFMAPVIYFLMIICTPLAAAINYVSTGIIKLLGVDRKSGKSYTEKEIRSIVEVSSEEGVIENEEKQLIDNVFDFNDTTVKEVMVPRINVAAINQNASYDEITKIFKEEYFTRLPVYDEEEKGFIGLVNVKDIAFYDADKKDSFTVKSIIRELEYTFENRHLSELFLEMKKKSFTMMAVMDEYGDTTGIITMEDLLEEIVGDIRDEYDSDEDDEIKKLNDRTYLIHGHVSIADVNDKTGLALSSESYDSIGGLIIEKLDRLPVQGDSVEIDGVRIKAEKVDGTKIELVKVIMPNKSKNR